MSQKLKLLLVLLIINLVFLFRIKTLSNLNLFLSNMVIILSYIAFNRKKIKRTKYKYYFK